MPSVLPWSWSTLEAYRTCPKRYYEVKIARSCQEPPSEHLTWGNAAHKALEMRVGYDHALPTNMVQWEKLAYSLSNAPGDKYCELKTAVTKDFQPCDFFSPMAWNRGVDDLLIINGSNGLSIDYKTGKEKKYSQQLELSAARSFALFPQLTKISTAFAWLNTGNFTRATFVRDQVSGIWASVQEDIAQMLWSEKHNTWPAKPSGLCKRGRKPGSTYLGCPVTNCPHSENFRKGG